MRPRAEADEHGCERVEQYDLKGTQRSHHIQRATRHTGVGAQRTSDGRLNKALDSIARSEEKGQHVPSLRQPFLRPFSLYKRRKKGAEGRVATSLSFYAPSDFAQLGRVRPMRLGLPWRVLAQLATRVHVVSFLRFPARFFLLSSRPTPSPFRFPLFPSLTSHDGRLLNPRPAVPHLPPFFSTQQQQ